MNQRIVCAANKYFDIYGDEYIVAGVRHLDEKMCSMIGIVDDFKKLTADEVQGFLDNKGNFLSRTEAWKVAESAAQIIRRVGGDDANGGTLYSENLY